MLRRYLALPDQVMLLKNPARLGGALNRVIVFRDKLAVGSVISTRSSLRNCLRSALTDRSPQSKRRLRPPSELMDCVTSLGSNEFCLTKLELDA